MGVHKLCSSLIILGYLQSCTVLALWLTSRSLSPWVMLSHCATVKRSESDWTFTRVSSGLLVTRMKWIWLIFYSFVIRSICDLKKRHAWNSKNFWGSWAPRLDSPNFCWWFFCLCYWGHVWIRWWTNNQLQRDWTPVSKLIQIGSWTGCNRGRREVLPYFFFHLVCDFANFPFILRNVRFRKIVVFKEKCEIMIRDVRFRKTWTTVKENDFDTEAFTKLFVQKDVTVLFFEISHGPPSLLLETPFSDGFSCWLMLSQQYHKQIILVKV